SWPGLWQRAARGARRPAASAGRRSPPPRGEFVEEDAQHPLVELLVEGWRGRIAVMERMRLEHEEAGRSDQSRQQIEARENVEEVGPDPRRAPRQHLAQHQVDHEERTAVADSAEAVVAPPPR